MKKRTIKADERKSMYRIGKKRKKEQSELLETGKKIKRKNLGKLKFKVEK